MHGTRWLIVVSILCLCFLASSVGGVASSFMDSETSTGNGFQAWTSRLWTQTTQADFESGVSGQADTWSTPGDVILARNDGVFAFQGGSLAFWKYGNPWTSMANAPATVGAGGALAYDGARYIYALQGGGQVGFWRFDTRNNVWATRASAPGAVGAGGALAYDGARYVYAVQGGGQLGFWRYDTRFNTWATRASAPGAVGAGGALAFDGAGSIYAFQGGSSTALWRFSIAGNAWTAMTSAPAAVGAGGALVYVRSGQIYALGGNSSDAFWKYDTLANAWAVLIAAPGGVNAGGALAVVPGNAYVTSATVSSAVLDTGIAGDRWDALIWDETVPNRTNIAFEVRASDTPFDADDATLSWTSVGGTSPISSGLPAGRYKQWRATLTTTNTGRTPRLLEVRLYYS